MSRTWTGITRGIILGLLLTMVAEAAPRTSGGPGGIGTIDGLSSLQLWLDPGTLTDLTNGQGVALWRDGSGKWKHAVQTNPAYQPTFLTNVLNGRPVLRFPNSTAITNFFAPVTLQSSDSGMSQFHVLNAAPVGYAVVIEVQGGGHPMFFISNSSYTTWNPPSCSGVGDWDIMSVHSRTNLPTIRSIHEDGVLRSSDAVSYVVPSSATYTLFSRSSSLGFYKGDFAEMVVHGTCLNAAQRTLIENYLSSKYDNALNTAAGAADLYAGDTPANGNYDTDVFGIGRSNATEAVTNAGMRGLGFEATGSTLNVDGEWVLAGHNGINNVLVTTDLPASVSQRWARVWYVDKTGSVDVDMAFDYGDAGLAAPGAGAKFFLLRSAGQGPFAFTTQLVSYVRSGDTVTFSLPDASYSDGYYTLGSDEALPAAPAAVTSGGGPGGIGTTNGASSLELWLDASTLALADGTPVSSWIDLSGNGRNATQATVNNRPACRTGILNGKPIVRFTGGTNFFANTPNMDFDGGFTFCGVVTLANLGGGAGAGYHNILERFSGQQPQLWGRGDGVYEFNAAPTGANGGSLTDWDVLCARTRVSGPPYQWLFEDGIPRAQSATAVSVPASSAFQLFHRGTTDGMRGDAAEIIMFGTTLNDAQRVIVENYLSAKWNVPMDTAAGGALDVYAGDTAAKGDYDADVFGIGNVDGNKVVSSGTAGFGIAELGINDVLGAGEFVMAGHNGLPATEVPFQSTVRWGRVWYVDVTGSADCILTFDASDAGGTLKRAHRLLYKAQSADAWTPLSLPATISGDRVSFIVPAALMRDGYYTLNPVTSGSMIEVF